MNNKFKIGQTVKTINTDRKGNMSELISDYPSIVMVEFDDGFKDVHLTDNLIICEEPKERTNKIKRTSGSGLESVIEWDTDDKNIEINILGSPVHVTTILKILLKETELYNYEYHRVSPYKLVRVYDTEICGHVYTMEFIDIKDNFEAKKTELLTTNRSMQIEGKFNIFIPDFLELCVERNMLKRDGDRYILNRNLDSIGNDYIYLKNKPSVKALELSGFTVTEEYKKSR